MDMLDFCPQFFSSTSLLGVLTVLLLIFFTFFSSFSTQKPPGPRPLPLLGNLLQLDLKRPYKTLLEFSKKYGSVFTVYLGTKKVVVLAGYKTVKEALVDYDKVFGDRVPLQILDDISQGHGVLWSNGDSWKEMRRFALTNLRDFGMGKRASEDKITEECQYLVEGFKNFKGEAFDTTKPINCAVANIICSIVYGSRFDCNDPEFTSMLNRLKRNSKILGSPSIQEKLFKSTKPINCAVTNIICSIVYGSRFDYNDPEFTSMLNRLNRNSKIRGSPSIQLDDMFPSLFKWTANRKEFCKLTAVSTKQNLSIFNQIKETLNPQMCRGFVDAFLVRKKMLEESGVTNSHFHDDNLMLTVMNLFAAGTETTSTTLRWALLFMTKYPKIQDEVQEELRRVIGDRQVQVADRKSLPFTDAVIHETQRLSSILPAGLPHKTTRDITFQGHFIKKGTTVFPLLTSVLHDPDEWERPHSFYPAHFLDKDKKFVKRDAFIPFSAGRRVCLGEGLARMELFLFFATLLQHFCFTPAPGVSEDELDLTPSVGITLSPSPHKLCAVSRM